MLLIDFFETTPISSLVPVNSVRPDRVVFLIDGSHLDSLAAKHMRKAIEGLGCVKEFAYKPVNIRNINSIRSCLEGVVSRSREGEDVYIDLTGGSELMVAAGYSVSRETKAEAIYADLDQGKIIRADDTEAVCNVRHISSRDYLVSIGAKQLGKSHTDPDPEEEERICAMAEILFD
ncbi:MAG: DUF1887 family protein, partial [Mogibacterium sp.]|nr:DUF1887 family protein [Mogibacterium sp.]